MSKPQEELNNERYIKETFLFFDQFARTCQDTENCKSFLRELLTSSEMRMIKKRWFIARLLHAGMDVRSVAGEAKVSTTTVVRVSQTLKQEGSLFKRILDDLKKKELITDNGLIATSSREPETNSSTPTTHRYAFGHDEE